MALPSSGSITMAQVNVELGKAANAGITMNDSAVRALAGVPSGAISMSNLHGKSSEVRYINTVNRTQASIHTLMGSPTAAGTYIFENTATISAASAGGWALQTGAFPAGSTLKIINKGHIRGGGGNGGSKGSLSGGAGGSALVLNFPATIENTTGTIWGGGGGGGGTSGYVPGGGTVIIGGGGGGGIPAGAGGSTGGAGGKAGQAGTEVNGGAAGGNGGGAGGSVGVAGAAGAQAAGGRGGYSVETNGSAATWIAVGDSRGSVV